MDYMTEILRAKDVIEQSIIDAKNLAEKVPDGLVKVEALTLLSKLIQVSVILNIRIPAVPCRLDFVAEVLPIQVVTGKARTDGSDLLVNYRK